MSLMLSALKQLEGRRPIAVPAAVSTDQPAVEQMPSNQAVECEFDPYAAEPINVSPGISQYTASLPSRPFEPLTSDQTSDDNVTAGGNPLPLRFTGNDYSPLARRMVERIDRDACHSFLLHSINIETDDLFSLSTLGRALAGELSRRVLLVHTNRRLQSIIDTAAGEHLPGLMECLFAGAAWTQSIHPTSHPALDFVPRGENARRDGQIAELQFPGSWRKAYGAVLLGTAPHSQQLALDLSSAADATILAVKPGSSDRQALERSAASFRCAGARLAGCVALD